MAVYYRFQHEQPKPGEEVHCFTNPDHFRNFARMMKRDDPDFARMKFWTVEGRFVRKDEDDVVVRVIHASELRL